MYGIETAADWDFYMGPAPKQVAGMTYQTCPISGEDCDYVAFCIGEGPRMAHVMGAPFDWYRVVRDLMLAGF